jgi:hypothetical protein
MPVGSLQIAEDLERTIGTAVIDKENFVPHIHPTERKAELLMQFAQRTFFVEQGNENREIDSLLLLAVVVLPVALLPPVVWPSLTRIGLRLGRRWRCLLWLVGYFSVLVCHAPKVDVSHTL